MYVGQFDGKAHVRKVIDVRLIVQDQRVIAIPPIVADATLAIDNQRVYAQLCQACSD